MRWLIQLRNSHSEPDTEGFIRREYVVVNAYDPVEVVGHGAIWPQRAGRFRMDLLIGPTYRRRGIGSALLQHMLEELKAQKATVVQARAREDNAASLAFLSHRGFTETNRMTRLSLPVASASTAGLEELATRLQAQGVTITTLEQEQSPECATKIQELIRAANPGSVGDPYRVGGETEPCSADDARYIWESYNPLEPEAFFLAKVQAEYIGLSFLGAGDAADSVVQGDTAVHTDWRRQGVATLLKLHTLRYAQQKGIAEIVTSTASPGMLALNRRLGFEIEWTEVRMVKELATG